MTVPFQFCFGVWCALYGNVTYCYRLAYDFSYLIFLWSLCQWALAQMVPPSHIIKRVEDEVVGSRPTNCVYNLPLNKMFLMALFEAGWNWVLLSTQRNFSSEINMVKRVLASNIFGVNKLYNISLHKLKATSSQSYCQAVLI